MSFLELLPLVDELPHADKLLLMQVLLRKIAAEENIDLDPDNVLKSVTSPNATKLRKIRLQDLVPRQVEAFKPLSRDAVYER